MDLALGILTRQSMLWDGPIVRSMFTTGVVAAQMGGIRTKLAMRLTMIVGL